MCVCADVDVTKPNEWLSFESGFSLSLNCDNGIGKRPSDHLALPSISFNKRGNVCPSECVWPAGYYRAANMNYKSCFKHKM